MTDMTLRCYLTASDQLANLIFLLEDIASACRMIATLVREGAFAGNLGSAGAISVQGEPQKTLNILANDAFERICSNSPRLTAKWRGVFDLFCSTSTSISPWQNRTVAFKPCASGARVWAFEGCARWGLTFRHAPRLWRRRPRRLR